jgi:hypothetical protein
MVNTVWVVLDCEWWASDAPRGVLSACKVALAMLLLLEM